MNLLRLLRRLGPQPIRQLVLAAAGSALCSTVVLAIVNVAAQNIAAERADFVDLKLGLLFVAALAGFWTCQVWLVRRTASALEQVVEQLRLNLLQKIRHADLLKLEEFGQTRLFESISQSSQTISHNSHFLALTLQSVLLTFAVLFYVAFIHLMAFVLIAGLLTLGAWFYVRQGRKLQVRQRRMLAKEADLFEVVSDLFDGFKEQRINSARSQAMNDSFAVISAATVVARNVVHKYTWQQFIFGEMVFNVMLGLVLFIAPTYATGFASAMAPVAAAVLFMAAPVFGIMQSLAIMSDAEAAAGSMLELEPQLADLAEAGSEAPGEGLPTDFQKIAMKAVTFSFPGDSGKRGFSVGPLDLTVKQGEMVFVTGGNGSGKSTLIKLLTGLYRPSSGRLMLDDIPIDAKRLGAWREKMATVFADFHLFERLYGSRLDGSEANELMAWLEMDAVTKLQGDHFDRRKYSAGQRKRLALVAALLERKPILILDEWAADQDPHFRRKFYHDILPALKERGLTIIAVTHDDNHFVVADRWLHMENGCLRELPKPPTFVDRGIC